MRSDLRLFTAEHDGAGDPVLPPDLAALAEQLTADAERLTAQYPVAGIKGAGCERHVEILQAIATNVPVPCISTGRCSPPSSMSSQVQRIRRAWIARAAAAALFLAAAWSATLVAWHRPRHISPVGLRTLEQREAPGGTADSSSSAAAPATVGAFPLHPVVDAADLVVPAGLFQALTPPQQEGLLDLLEDEHLVPASLSI